MGKQPESFKNLNREEFLRIRESLIYKKKEHLNENNPSKTDLPLDMGLFLTGKCNLRCRHCFEWNSDGFLTKDEGNCKSAELDIDKIEECLKYTESAGTRLYLWGGEPLLYSRFHELCNLIKKYGRWTTVCTNGLLIKDNIDDLISISDHTVLLISLDGFRECNDAIRGKGTFDRVIENINYLSELSEKGIYKGEVSVCCVLSDALIERLYDFCLYMDKLNINSLYISFPWYISEDTAAKMDGAFDKRFGDIIKIDDYSKASWHDFTYHISPESIVKLKDEMRRISERRWNIRVRFQPAVSEDDIEDFVTGGVKTAQGMSKCLAPFNRIDILQNGNVSACKLFKEFSVGNLNSESVGEIWEGEKMQEMRKRLQCGLMPVCSKCVLLYLNGTQ